MTQDRRIRKSQQAIEQALLTLLTQRTFDQISVQQIVKEADVNRSTFYAHYLDKYDLLEKMEDARIEAIASYTTTESQNYEVSFSETLIKNVMQKIIHHIEENMTFYYLSLESVGKDSKLLDKLYQQIYKHLTHYKNHNTTDAHQIPFDYFISYVSGAGLSMIQHWIKDKSRISADLLVESFYIIVSEGPAEVIRQQRI